VKLAVASPPRFLARQRKVPFSSVVALRMRSSLFRSVPAGVEVEVEEGTRKGLVLVSIKMFRDEFETGTPLNHHSRLDSGVEVTLHNRDTFFPSPGKRKRENGAQAENSGTALFCLQIDALNSYSALNSSICMY
jgi:hypothetical protein